MVTLRNLQRFGTGGGHGYADMLAGLTGGTREWLEDEGAHGVRLPNGELVRPGDMVGEGPDGWELAP